MSHHRIAVVDGGRRYWVEIDAERTLLSAQIEIHAHDKAMAARRVKHPVTLARLQALIRPPARCPHCGAEAGV